MKNTKAVELRLGCLPIILLFLLFPPAIIFSPAFLLILVVAELLLSLTNGKNEKDKDE